MQKAPVPFPGLFQDFGAAWTDLVRFSLFLGCNLPCPSSGDKQFWRSWYEIAEQSRLTFAVSQLSNPIAKIPFRLSRACVTCPHCTDSLRASWAAFVIPFSVVLPPGAVLLWNKPDGAAKLPLFEPPCHLRCATKHSRLPSGPDPPYGHNALGVVVALAISSMRFLASSSCSNRLSHISRRGKDGCWCLLPWE